MEGGRAAVVWTWILGVVLIAGGLFLAINPRLFWRLAERWKSYYADEPSDLYINWSRIGGPACAVLGAVLIVLPYVL